MPLDVLHVVPSFRPATAYGGPLQSTLDLCRGAKLAGSRVRVLTSDANGPRRVDRTRALEFVNREGFPVTYCTRIGTHCFAPGMLIRLPWSVARAHVIHLTGVFDMVTIATLLACRTLNKPVMWSPRGGLQASVRQLGFRKRIWLAACRLILPKRHTIHYTSHEESEASRHTMPKSPFVVVPIGVEVPEPRVFREHSEDLRLLFLGRLHPIKGLDNLIAALGRLVTNGWKAWHLRIAGDGEPSYVELLEQKVLSSGLDKYVTFTGHVSGEAKRRQFQWCDILVAPSERENFGRSIAEALAAGIPVLAGTGTPWSRIVQERCGYWVPNDPESLAAAIAGIDRTELAAMGARGREFVMRELDISAQSAKIIAEYARLTGRA